MSSALDELRALEDHGAFAARHIGPSEAEVAAMLEALGLPDLEALAERTVPAAIRGQDFSALPAPVNEAEAIAELRADEIGRASCRERVLVTV